MEKDMTRTVVVNLFDRFKRGVDGEVEEEEDEFGSGGWSRRGSEDGSFKYISSDTYSERSRITNLDENDKEEELVLENIVFIPFGIKWQALLVVSINFQFIFNAYTTFFSGTAIFHDIATVDIYVLQMICLLYLCEILFWMDTVLLLVHRFWKRIQSCAPFQGPRLLQLAVAIATLPSAISFLYNNGNDARLHVRVLKWVGFVRLVRAASIILDGLRSVYYGGWLIFAAIIETIIVVYIVMAVYFYQFEWNEPGPWETADDTLAFKVPALVVRSRQPLISWPMNTSLDMFLMSIYIMGNCFQSRGQIGFGPDQISTRILYQFYMLTSLMFTTLITALYASILLHTEWTNVLYNYRKENLKFKMEAMGTDPAVKKRAINWYTLLWEKREAILTTEMDSLLSTGLLRDCALDVYWPAFKHSHIFRNKDLQFLSAVSMRMSTEFHCPGDVLFKKGMVKHRFIYILHGIVQVMSRYDHLTPLISLFPGTCIGESTLYCSYPCSAKVVCATYCELMVFSKRQINQLYKNFPDQCKSMSKEVLERLDKAKLLYGYKSLKNTTDALGALGLHSDGPMKRIKRVAREIDREIFLKEAGHFDEEDKLMKNTDVLTLKPEYIGSCSDYLDMLVISEHDEQVNDKINFLNTDFPIIFHPNSPFIKLEENVIVILTAFFLCFIPIKTTVSYELESVDLLVWVSIQIIFMVDVFLQCTTAVFTPDKNLVTMKEIFFYRLTTNTFICDLFGSIPFNWFLFFLESTDPMQFGVIGLNYLARNWRIRYFFQKVTNSNFTFRSNLFQVACLVYFMYGILYFTMVLTLVNCMFDGKCNPNGMWNKLLGFNDPNVMYSAYDILRKTFLATTILTLGTGGRLYVPLIKYECIFALLMDIFCMIANAYFIAGLTTVIVLYMALKEYEEVRVYSVIHLMKQFDLPPDLQYRVYKKLKLQATSPSFTYEFRGDLDLYDMSEDIKSDIKLQDLAILLLKVPLFENTEKGFVTAIAKKMTYHIYPANEMVSYSGVWPRCMFVIRKGYCELLNPETGSVQGKKGPGWYFSCLELLFNIPVIQTVRTETCVSFVRLSEDDLRSVLHEFPEYMKQIRATKKKCQQLFYLPVVEGTDLQHRMDTDGNVSFHNFGYQMVVGSPEEKEYLGPFYKMAASPTPGYIVSRLLLRTTLIPDGQAIFALEIARCCFALISSLCFPIRTLLVYKSENFHYIFRALDLLAFVDIYIRLHVTYYNELGILVTHPLKTASYYLRTSFAMDLFACFPFEVVFFHLVDKKFKDCLSFNRLFQMHRFHGFIGYISARSIAASIYPLVLNYFLILLVILNLLTSIWMMIFCGISNDIAETSSGYNITGIHCFGLTWNTETLGHVITPEKVFLIAQLYMTLFFTQMNVIGFAEDWDDNGRVTLFISIIGFSISLYITGKLSAAAYLQNRGIRYLQRVKALKRFLEISNVRKEIRAELKLYYDTVWERHQGKNPRRTISLLSTVLQGDIFYHMYGKTVKDATLFSKSTDYFFRSLISIFDPKVHHKGSQILDEGYIHSNIYLLVDGCITVISGKRPVVSLGKGAFFGNLDDIPIYQQSVGIKASTVVEILVMRTGKFYSVLNAFPKYRDLFKEWYTHYLERGLCVIPGTKAGAENIIEIDQVLIKDTNFLISVQFEVMKCCLSILTTLFTMYSIAVYDMSPIMIGFFYLSDYLGVLCILLNCYQPYVDESGEFVRDLAMVRSHYLKQPYGFFLDFASVIPFEVFYYFFEDSRSAFLWLRFNRVLQMLYPVTVLDLYNRKRPETMFILRIVSLFIKFYYLIISFSFVFLCIYEPFESTDLKTDWYTKANRFVNIVCLIMANFARFPSDISYPYLKNGLFLFRTIQMVITSLATAIMIGYFIFYIQLKFYSILLFFQKKKAILKMLETQMVAKYLYNCVNTYLMFLWQYNNGCQMPDILYEAPVPLQHKLLRSLYGHHVRNHYILSELSEEFLNQVIVHLRSEMLLPGNVIVRAGTVDNTMYFVQKGQVKAYMVDLDGSEVPTLLLHGNNHFGTEQGLNYTVPHRYTFRSSTMTSLLKLNFNKWAYLLDYYPLVRTKIYRLLQKRKESGNVFV